MCECRQEAKEKKKIEIPKNFKNVDESEYCVERVGVAWNARDLREFCGECVGNAVVGGRVELFAVGGVEAVQLFRVDDDDEAFGSSEGEACERADVEIEETEVVAEVETVNDFAAGSTV